MEIKNEHRNNTILVALEFSAVLIICLMLLNVFNLAAQSSDNTPGTEYSKGVKEKVRQIYTSQIGIREKQPNSGPAVDEYLKYVGLSKGHPWCAAFVCWVLGKAGVENPRSGWSPALFREDKIIWSRDQGTKSKEQGFPPSVEREPRAKSQESRRPQSALGGETGTRSYWEQGTRSKEQGFPPDVEREPRIKSQESRFTRAVTGCSWSALASRFSLLSTPRTGDVFGLYFPEKRRIAHVGFIDQWDGTWLITVEGNTNLSGGREGDGVYRKRRLVSTIYKVARYVRVPGSHSHPKK